MTLPTSAVGPEPDIFVLKFPSGSGRARLLEEFHARGVGAPARALARTLSASHPARAMALRGVGVSEEPSPAITFAVEGDPEALARLGELPGLLDELGTRLRIVTWVEVERAVDALASAFIEVVGRSELKRATLIGLPRGGQIVGALVAYALDIPADRFGGSPARDGLTLMIDDCLLSGLRLRRAVEGWDGGDLAVGMLFAPDGVEASVRGLDPRIRHFVAGERLADHAESLLGASAAAWRSQWRARVPDRLHTALLDVLVLPWREPDMRLLNAASGKIERSWQVVPAELCFANRYAEAPVAISDGSRHHPSSSLLPHVQFLEAGDSIFLVDTVSDRIVRLSGAGAELCRAWLANGAAAAVRVMTDAYDVTASQVERDLRAMLDDLRERGLLA